MMTTYSKSALRRIMEKYTKNVRFILICNQIHRIHPAIQIRYMRFRPIQNDKCLNRLKEICNCENIKYDNELTLKTVIQSSNRDIRKMLNLLEATLIYSQNNNYITINNIYTTAGLPSLNLFNQILKYINTKNLNIGKIYNKLNNERLTN